MAKLADLWNDVRYGARNLAARPTFTIVAVLTLALGIGVNVAMFSLFRQILLRELPVAAPEQLVNLNDPGPKPDGLRYGSMAGGGDSVFSYPMFRDLERRQEPFAGIAAHRLFDANVSTGEEARRDTGMFVSGSYFPLLGLRPSLGRLLGPQDDAVDGSAESVVLSHAYWQSAFGADAQVVGRTLIVNGTSLAIVGVAPPGFQGTTVGTRASVFVPMSFRGIDAPFSIPDHDDREFYWVHLFARLPPGVEREAAAAAVNPVYRAILNELDLPLLVGEDEATLQQFRTKPLVLTPGARGQTSGVLLGLARVLAGMLLAVSGVVLLLCCANVAGLVLVRSSTRRGEIAVRAAMGATRGRLVSLLLVESLLLALPAAVLSLPLAWLTLRSLANGVPGLPPVAFDTQLSMGPALAAVALAVASALVFGLSPIRSLTRADPGKTLQAYGVRQTSGKGITLFRTGLATVQIALSMTLLALMGVFAQSLANIARIDLGLDVEPVLTFSFSPGASGYSTESSAQLFERLETELAVLPGVASIASSAWPILSGGSLDTGVRVGGAEQVVRTHINSISPDLFRTLGVDLLAGRDFSEADVAGTADVVIVNRRFAEQLGADENPVGRPVGAMGAEAVIVGLVADANDDNVTSEVAPQLFRPRAQDPGVSATFYVRAVRSAEGLIAAVREAAGRVDPTVPITDLRTLQQQVRENVGTERYVAAAATAFAMLATLLAGLGLYGALAYAVALRSREIGLRLALGAPAGRIRGMVIKHMTAMTLVGVAVGAGAAWVLARAARSLLVGVEAADPLALAGAAAIVAAVTIGAAYVPARRASRVDPIVVLRYE